MLQRYTPARELGASAIARTFLAVQHGGAGLRRLVVVKDVNQRGDADRLFRRTRILAPLEHPHLARVIDQGIERRRAFVVYDYVIGESALSILARCVKAGQPVPLQIAVRLTADACAGLHAAHAAGAGGVLHGALRPSNVMVSFDGCAKVTDCGLTDLDRIRREVELTPAQAHFLAPEVLEQRPVDARVDVYSAAVLLYALLTLRYPHDAHRSVAEVMERKRHPVVPPTNRNDAVPPELERLLQAALAPDPSGRPRSAAAFRYDLEGFLIRHGRFATHLAVADYLASLYGRRIRAKREALDELLSLPPGQTMASDTIVEVVDEFDRKTIDDMFSEQVKTSVDDPAWLADQEGDAPPTTPEVGPWKGSGSIEFEEDTDTGTGTLPPGAPAADDDDTAVG